MVSVEVQYYKTKIGELILGSFDNKLCLLDFRYRRMRKNIDERIQNNLKVKFIEQNNNILITTRKQIDEYLAGNRKIFNIPIIFIGSQFQKQVWQELMNVEYGKTISYSDLAIKINNPKAVRAVGSANGANAIAIIVPCHRVINSNGELGGYGGGLRIKQKLLNIERNS